MLINCWILGHVCSFLNKTFRWFEYVCIKMWTCKISARFYSPTEMFPNQNGPYRNVPRPKRPRRRRLRPKRPRPKRLRPNRPDRKVAYPVALAGGRLKIKILFFSKHAAKVNQVKTWKLVFSGYFCKFEAHKSNLCPPWPNAVRQSLAISLLAAHYRSQIII